jgi:quinol monooxygenase YgiN
VSVVAREVRLQAPDARRGDAFAKIAEEAKSKGALHHRFGSGDGFALVVDEWQDADAFMQFFSNPELQTFIASVGGDTSTPSER